jgi:hypothetical protein
MVLQERIELSTSPLPRECSTTELLQRRVMPEAHGRLIRRNPASVQGQFSGQSGPCRAAAVKTFS